MALYDEICSEHRITVAQILVTSRDFTSRTSYLNLRGSCEALLSLNTLPIFNENDVVSVAGIREQDVASDMRGQKSFDDNDKLSALVAAKLSADMLVILTNVDGVYSDNPNTNPHAALISRISSLHDLDAVSCSGKSSLGRGGMSSKLDAAKIAGMCGVTTIISSAWSQNPVSSAMQGQQGTTVSLGDSVPIPRLNGRQRWFGLSSGYAGAVTIDARARHTLESAPCSLLPVGVLKVDGDFGPGDIISIVDEGGEEIGRGVSNQSADSLRQIAGKKTHEARALLPRDEKEEVIHRDNLVIFTESHHAA
jgi:glutamate 5-kinase